MIGVFGGHLRSIATGLCAYCGAENVAILAPPQLAEYFELLISAYRPDADGKLLVQWFREDWGMFAHERMDDPRAKDLLSEILDNGEIVRQTFSPAIAPGADRLGEWEKLRDELMYHNRFFPDANIDLDRLEILLSPLTLDADEIPDLWHRARIKTLDTAFPIEEMGAPPKRIASHGGARILQAFLTFILAQRRKLRSRKFDHILAKSRALPTSKLRTT